MMKRPAIVQLFLVTVMLFTAGGNVFSEEIVDYNWWWLFYEHEQTRRYDASVPCRPFYMTTTYNSGNKRFFASLMPLVFWGYEKPNSYEWKSLFGLMGSVDYTHRNGVRDYDFGAFPFLLYGNSPDERDRYLHVWPIGGTIRGKLGQDRIEAWVFPGVLLFYYFPPTFPPSWVTIAVLVASLIPLYVEYESGDYRAWGILWPLIQRGRSPNRDDFRILPFYAHNYKRNYYDNYSYLLLFNYQNVFSRNDVQKTFFAVPFYGRRWSRSRKTGSSALLWPFFSWGYNKKTVNFEINFPWPLVQIQDCMNPYIRKRIYFPFYGSYRYRNKSAFFITPLYFSLTTETGNFRSEYYINCFIIWYFKRDYRTTTHPVYGNKWRYFKIWPLFQYEHDDRGNMTFNMLSLLPFRDPEGYERMYQPFWTLFEYRRFQCGERRLGLLLRLYYQRWGDHYLHVKIPILFTYSESGNRVREVSILLSMFSYENTPAGRYLRLLWIPLRIGNGDPSCPHRSQLRCEHNDSGVNTPVYSYTNLRYNELYDTGLNTPGCYYTGRVF